MGLGDFIRYIVFADILSEVGPKMSDAFNTTLSEMETLLSDISPSWETTIPANIYVPILGTPIVFDLRATEAVWNAMPWSTIKSCTATIFGVITWPADLLDTIKIPFTDEFLFKEGDTVDYGKNFDPVKKISLYDVYVVKLYWKLILLIVKIIRNIIGEDGAKHFLGNLLSLGTLFNNRRNVQSIISGTTKGIAQQMGEVNLDDIESDLDDLELKLDSLSRYKPYG